MWSPRLLLLLRRRDEIWVAILKHGRSLRNVGIPLLLLLLYFNDNLVGFLQMMDVNRMLLYNWDDRMQGSIGRIGSFEKGCESEKVNYYYYNSSLGSSCQFLLLLLLLLRMCLGKSKNPPFFTEKQKRVFLGSVFLLLLLGWRKKTGCRRRIVFKEEIWLQKIRRGR